MLERLLRSLYSHLLKLYPERFREDFGEEMGEVFAQTLASVDVPGSSPAERRAKMRRLFFREVWYFPSAYLDARCYQASTGTGVGPPVGATFEEGQVTETGVGRGASWGEAIVGAIPFLLFGLAYLLEGIAELSGNSHPAFDLTGGSLGWGAMHLTLPMGVYFACAVGLSFGVIKGFPRWSFAYLGMAYYFGWSYNNQNYYGLFYKWWVWLPLLAGVALGLLLAHSLKPLAEMVRGVWRDWTRLSFGLYAFALPMFTIIFFDGDWGAAELYGLLFDSVLLAAIAVAFLRSRSGLSRVLWLEGAVLFLVVEWILGGGVPAFDEPLRVVYFWTLFISIYFGFLLLPGVIGLLRRGVKALTAR